MAEFTSKVAVVTQSFQRHRHGDRPGTCGRRCGGGGEQLRTSKEWADRTVDEIRGKGHRTIAVQADVSKPADGGRRTGALRQERTP